MKNASIASHNQQRVRKAHHCLDRAQEPNHLGQGPCLQGQQCRLLTSAMCSWASAATLLKHKAAQRAIADKYRCNSLMSKSFNAWTIYSKAHLALAQHFLQARRASEIRRMAKLFGGWVLAIQHAQVLTAKARGIFSARSLP